VSTAAAEDRLNLLYLFSAVVLPLAAPALFVAYDLGRGAALMGALAKWFAFWAVGVRLGLAGLRQALNPRFTAETIFGVKDVAAFPIVREVGMANLSFAALGLASFFVAAWRPAALLAGGVYFGLAAAGHIGHKPATKNETVALTTDILVFVALAGAFVCAIG
jgi:hypothetical protein